MEIKIENIDKVKALTLTGDIDASTAPSVTETVLPSIEIKIEDIDNVKVVTLTGDIDASTAPSVTETVLPLVQENSRLLLNMAGVPYMSSAGLRTLLSLARQANTKHGNLVLVGLSEDLTDTMSVTGFLDLFVTKSTQDQGLAALKEVENGTKLKGVENGTN